MRDAARFSNDYVLINNIVNSEAQARPGRVYYVDTVSALGNATGGYADDLLNPDGTVVRVRASDGVHFTRAGGDRIAAKILAAMNQAFDLTSWLKAQSTTTTTTTPGTKARRPAAATTTTPTTARQP